MALKDAMNEMLVSTLYAGILGIAAGVLLGVAVLWLVNFVMDKREETASTDSADTNG